MQVNAKFRILNELENVNKREEISQFLNSSFDSQKQKWKANISENKHHIWWEIDATCHNGHHIKLSFPSNRILLFIENLGPFIYK